jgi:predicted metal-binding protein
MDEVILEEGEMTKETAAALAEEIGFKGRGIFETKDLNFLKEVRDMCKANKCGNYGRLWTCPPACGTLADSRKKARQFKWGIVLQTTAHMEDEFDGEAIEEAQVTQRDRFLKYVGRLREMGEEAFLPMGSGGCGQQCASCTYPDAPCRFPDRAFTSMEAYGLLVTDVCKSADTPYYYGRNTVTFTGCVLFI